MSGSVAHHEASNRVMRRISSPLTSPLTSPQRQHGNPKTWLQTSPSAAMQASLQRQAGKTAAAGKADAASGAAAGNTPVGTAEASASLVQHRVVSRPKPRPQNLTAASRGSVTPHRGSLTPQRGSDEGPESVAALLLAKNLLTDTPRPWNEEETSEPALDDLTHVHALFSAQVPDAEICGVYRVDNSGLVGVYEAVRSAMGEGTRELDLWHGTTADCMPNIVNAGFNRAYSGRHGTKLGQGTYFAASAEYSLRFCGRSSGATGGRRRRAVLLARVLVGECTKGSPDLVEPPYRDAEQMVRYDSTVDDEESPTMYCIFRDFQAVPRYLVEFVG